MIKETRATTPNNTTNFCSDFASPASLVTIHCKPVTVKINMLNLVYTIVVAIVAGICSCQKCTNEDLKNVISYNYFSI